MIRLKIPIVVSSRVKQKRIQYVPFWNILNQAKNLNPVIEESIRNNNCNV